MGGICLLLNMNVLPNDIQWLIWRSFFSKFVLNKIIEIDCIWRNPSDHLIELCKDNGTIQQSHMEIQDMIEDENMWCWHACIKGKCENCQTYGFPCLNLASYGFRNKKLASLWKSNFI